VTELRLDADVAVWLRAIGISEGEQVIVLRSAAFGGPIHVRTNSGGEFALHRSLAASILTRRAPSSPWTDAERPP
jgi:ferrous iron transport protein A